MNNEVEINVLVKEASGKGPARRSRLDGRLPAILYGYKSDNRMITIEERALVRALSTSAGKNVFLRLKSDDKELDGQRAFIRDLQVHPLKRRFIHADLYKIDPTREMHATVPLRMEGTAVGVKLGGILSVARHEVKVVCLPDDLPEALVVDVSALNVGDSIHVSDLDIPEGVTILSGSRLAVCAVVSPTKEDEPGAEELEEGEEGEASATDEGAGDASEGADEE